MQITLLIRPPMDSLKKNLFPDCAKIISLAEGVSKRSILTWGDCVHAYMYLFMNVCLHAPGECTHKLYAYVYVCLPFHACIFACFLLGSSQRPKPGWPPWQRRGPKMENKWSRSPGDRYASIPNLGVCARIDFYVYPPICFDVFGFYWYHMYHILACIDVTHTHFTLFLFSDKLVLLFSNFDWATIIICSFANTPFFVSATILYYNEMWYLT